MSVFILFHFIFQGGFGYDSFDQKISAMPIVKIEKHCPHCECISGQTIQLHDSTEMALRDVYKIFKMI